MNPFKELNATFWAMVAIQTIGSIDAPSKGPRKMPAPRSYVATFVLWGILDLFAELGTAQARLAAKLSLLVLLVGAILGPFGATVTSFLNTVAKQFAVPPPAGVSAPATPPTTTEV